MDSDTSSRRDFVPPLTGAWSEGWMRVFLESAVDAIIIIDSKGRIESFNPAAERMFGYRDLDVVGLNVSMLMPQPFAGEHDGYLAAYLETGQPKIIGLGREVEARRKDGSLFPAHLSVSEMGQSGERHFTGVIRDLSRERDARAREVDTARILENSVNEILVFDAETLRLIRVNDRARVNLGYSMGELSGMTPLELEIDPDERAFRARLSELALGERDRVVYFASHRRKNGETYPVEVHIQYAAFAGRPVFVAFVLDITEREELQRQLLHAQKLEAIGRLAGALAHDFNNLLMGITSGCRMVAERVQDDADTLRMLGEVRDEAQRGTGITRQLLDFSRKRSYEARPCDLSAMVERSSRLFRKLLGEDVELRVDARAHGCPILADPGKLEQVLMNLVVNARDAMPDGGSLRIVVERVEIEEARPGLPTELAPGAFVCVEVADNGCGMDADTQAHVFEPFFTTKEVGRGTGLGLSTVFGLTREFGGTVELESEPDQGTTFRLLFPAIDPSSLPAEPSDAEDEKPVVGSVGGETILLVEDAVLVRAGIRNMLEGLGYRVLTAATPARALELLSEEPKIDAVLTDMVMPGMNGTELARRVRAERPGLPVLYMSAYSDEALIEQGRVDAGMPVLEKPFEQHELARRLRAVLDA